MVETNADWIQHLLFFGYVPTIPDHWRQQSWANVQARPDLVEMRDERLRDLVADSFKDACSGAGGARQVVLLSGGNDSRAILGGLLANYGSAELLAVTYGTPGTFDFEIPRLLASRAGVEHVAIDLSAEQFTSAELTDVATELSASPMWLFGPLMNRKVTKLIGADATYWSGYLGGPTTGSHAPMSTPSISWEAARHQHANRKPFGSTDALIASDYHPVDAYPDDFPDFASPVTLDERVDLVVRQHRWFYPEHVVGGYEYRLPFLDPRFLEVMFNVGLDRRRGQVLYLSAMSEAFPRLFELPHKDHLGLRPSAGAIRRRLKLSSLRSRRVLHRYLPRSTRWVSKSTNHIDWDHAMRHRADFRELCDEYLPALSDRRACRKVDPFDLLELHRGRKVDAGLALSLLLSLEVFLRRDGPLADRGGERTSE